MFQPMLIPPRDTRFDCSNFGAAKLHTLLSDGSATATPLPCGQCDGCKAWAAFLVEHRQRYADAHPPTC